MSHYIGPKLEAHEDWCDQGAELVDADTGEPTGELEQCTCGFAVQRAADRCTFTEKAARDLN